MRSLVWVSAQLVAWIAFLRCAGVLVALARQGLRRKNTKITQWGWTENLAAPEPFLMVAFAYLLSRGSTPDGGVSAVQAGLAITGCILATLGLAVWVWGFATIPSLSSGHYILPKQELITTGAFRFVRHPIYLGVFLLWMALAAASASIMILVVAITYVIPVYLLYIRSEERMMLAHFGASYRAYQAHTGMILPRLRKHASRQGGTM